MARSNAAATCTEASRWAHGFRGEGAADTGRKKRGGVNTIKKYGFCFGNVFVFDGALCIEWSVLESSWFVN